MRKFFITGLLVTLLFPILVNAQTDSTPKSATLELSDETIAATKGDIHALYAQWISPLRTGPDWLVSSSSNAEALIKDGMSRFCTASEGVLSDTKTVYGNTYRCSSKIGVFMFLLEVRRNQNDKIGVYLDTPALIAARAEEDRKFAELKKSNGPTGWITTSEGRFKFLRLGTPKERAVIEVEVNGVMIPIEEISRIDFKDPCCDIVVTRRDGTSNTVRRSLIARMGVNATTNHGVNCRSAFTVVVSTRKRGPEVQVFSNFRGLRSIEIDPNLENWKAVSGGALPIAFDSRNCEAQVVGSEARSKYQQGAPREEDSSGSGFFVSADGHVLTNDHVAGDCGKIGVRALGSPEMSAALLGRDKANDLALLKLDGRYKSFAAFRATPMGVGEKVYAFGFPLTGLLSSEGNASEGLVSALSGLDSDSRHLQISAPVQPGNSGGPVYDSAGAVVGVVVSKLNASMVMRTTGDIPQNVNFAIKQNVATTFLESLGVRVSKSSVTKAQDAVSIFSKARRETVFVRCSE